MLIDLVIRNFAIIEETRIEFKPGLNAVTGETGAGKSILIDALGAVLGERVGPDVIRTGTRAALIEATFDVSRLVGRPDLDCLFDEMQIEAEDDLLILSREVSASSRSTARINGRAVTAAMLARLGALLVDIHGQSDHLSLLRPAEHGEILDRFAGTIDHRNQLAGVIVEWRANLAAIDDLVGTARTRAQQADLLRFQVEEISAAALRSGEDAELIAERSILANAERLVLEAATAYRFLAGGDEATETAPVSALEAIRQATAHVAEIVAIDETAAELSERVAEVGFLLEEVAANVRAYRDGLEANPTRLATVEERIALLHGLKHKYGTTLEEVIRFGDEAAAELAVSETADADVEVLRARAENLRREIGERAGALSRIRDSAAERLGREVERAIADLKMGRAQFAVSLTQSPDPNGVDLVAESGETRTVRVDHRGVDAVAFLLAAHAGEVLKPLGRVASGGETARLMLALKSILAETDQTPTLVFDEVDVGVGGRSGQVVGEKLWGLAGDHQVVVITHLPQIAAFAEAHFRIAKDERADRVISEVAPVAGEERIDELAAMLDGLPVTAASRHNAAAMLERVSEIKASVGRRSATRRRT